MPVKTLLLIVSGAIVMAAIAYLWVDVSAAPAKVPAMKLAEAKDKYAVKARTKATAPSASNLDDPWSAAAREPTVKTVGTPVASEADTIEPEPTPAPEYRPATPQEASTPQLDGDPKLEVSHAKDEANRLYDKQDFEGAFETAKKLLEREPGDVRMLRVAVSAACQLGEADKAKQFYAQLPPHDQAQMARRCSRMNITFDQ